MQRVQLTLPVAKTQELTVVAVVIKTLFNKQVVTTVLMVTYHDFAKKR